MNANILRCPIDKGTILQTNKGFVCESCHFEFPVVTDNTRRRIPDFRCSSFPQKVQLQSIVPQPFLKPETIESYGSATNSKFKCPSRQELRRKYGTKLQKEILYYIEQLRLETGSNARILDLGCGSGGNTRYLKSAGFKQVVSVDYNSLAAEYLADVHRLPFNDSVFDMILSTATLEHFYNPFIAFSEISRVLKPGGMFIASASFWERWHSHSYFHYTPDGLLVLCRSVNLTIKDIWSGWGFIPSVSSHALGLSKLKPLTYSLQSLFDFVLGLIKGKEKAFLHRLRTSGSFGIFARKI